MDENLFTNGDTCIAVYFQKYLKNNVVDCKQNVILISLPEEDLNMSVFCFIFKSNYSIIPSLLKNFLEENEKYCLLVLCQDFEY